MRRSKPSIPTCRPIPSSTRLSFTQHAIYRSFHQVLETHGTACNDAIDVFQPPTLASSVHSFTYPANSYICETPHFRPPAIITPVIETVRHPYGIGPTKPVIRVPVTAPSLAPTQPALPANALVTKTGPFHCHHTLSLWTTHIHFQGFPATYYITFYF